MAEIKSGRVKKTPPGSVSADRYDFLSLAEAEPDLGVPAGNGYLVASNTDGTRSWVDPSNLTVTAVSPGGGGSTTIGTGTSTTTTSASAQVIDSTTALAVKYVIHASTSTSADVTEILAIASGASVSHVEYGRVSLGSDLASYDVQVSSGSIQLRATPSAAVETTYIISKQVLS